MVADGLGAPHTAWWRAHIKQFNLFILLWGIAFSSPSLGEPKANHSTTKRYETQKGVKQLALPHSAEDCLEIVDTRFRDDYTTKGNQKSLGKNFPFQADPRYVPPNQQQYDLSLLQQRYVRGNPTKGRTTPLGKAGAASLNLTALSDRELLDWSLFYHHEAIRERRGERLSSRTVERRFLIDGEIYRRRHNGFFGPNGVIPPLPFMDRSGRAFLGSATSPPLVNWSAVRFNAPLLTRLAQRLEPLFEVPHQAGKARLPNTETLHGFLRQSLTPKGQAKRQNQQPVTYAWNYVYFQLGLILQEVENAPVPIPSDMIGKQARREQQNICNQIRNPDARASRLTQQLAALNRQYQALARENGKERRGGMPHGLRDRFIQTSNETPPPLTWFRPGPLESNALGRELNELLGSMAVAKGPNQLEQVRALAQAVGLTLPDALPRGRNWVQVLTSLLRANSRKLHRAVEILRNAHFLSELVTPSTSHLTAPLISQASRPGRDLIYHLISLQGEREPNDFQNQNRTRELFSLLSHRSGSMSHRLRVLSASRRLRGQILNLLAPRAGERLGDLNQLPTEGEYSWVKRELFPVPPRRKLAAIYRLVVELTQRVATAPPDSPQQRWWQHVLAHLPIGGTVPPLSPEPSAPLRFQWLSRLGPLSEGENHALRQLFFEENRNARRGLENTARVMNQTFLNEQLRQVIDGITNAKRRQNLSRRLASIEAQTKSNPTRANQSFNTLIEDEKTGLTDEEYNQFERNQNREQPAYLSELAKALQTQTRTQESQNHSSIARTARELTHTANQSLAHAAERVFLNGGGNLLFPTREALFNTLDYLNETTHGRSLRARFGNPGAGPPSEEELAAGLSLLWQYNHLPELNREPLTAPSPRPQAQGFLPTLARLFLPPNQPSEEAFVAARTRYLQAARHTMARALLALDQRLRRLTGTEREQNLPALLQEREALLRDYTTLARALRQEQNEVARLVRDRSLDESRGLGQAYVRLQAALVDIQRWVISTQAAHLGFGSDPRSPDTRYVTGAPMEVLKARAPNPKGHSPWAPEGHTGWPLVHFPLNQEPAQPVTKARYEVQYYEGNGEEKHLFDTRNFATNHVSDFLDQNFIIDALVKSYLSKYESDPKTYPLKNPTGTPLWILQEPYTGKEGAAIEELFEKGHELDKEQYRHRYLRRSRRPASGPDYLGHILARTPAHIKGVADLYKIARESPIRREFRELGERYARRYYTQNEHMVVRDRFAPLWLQRWATDFQRRPQAEDPLLARVSTSVDPADQAKFQDILAYFQGFPPGHRAAEIVRRLSVPEGIRSRFREAPANGEGPMVRFGDQFMERWRQLPGDLIIQFHGEVRLGGIAPNAPQGEILAWLDRALHDRRSTYGGAGYVRPTPVTPPIPRLGNAASKLRRLQQTLFQDIRKNYLEKAMAETNEQKRQDILERGFDFAKVEGFWADHPSHLGTGLTLESTRDQLLYQLWALKQYEKGKIQDLFEITQLDLDRDFKQNPTKRGRLEAAYRAAIWKIDNYRYARVPSGAIAPFGNLTRAQSTQIVDGELKLFDESFQTKNTHLSYDAQESNHGPRSYNLRSAHYPSDPKHWIPQVKNEIQRFTGVLPNLKGQLNTGRNVSYANQRIAMRNIADTLAYCEAVRNHLSYQQREQQMDDLKAHAEKNGKELDANFFEAFNSKYPPVKGIAYAGLGGAARFNLSQLPPVARTMVESLWQRIWHEGSDPHEVLRLCRALGPAIQAPTGGALVHHSFTDPATRGRLANLVESALNNRIQSLLRRVNKRYFTHPNDPNEQGPLAGAPGDPDGRRAHRELIALLELRYGSVSAALDHFLQTHGIHRGVNRGDDEQAMIRLANRIRAGHPVRANDLRTNGRRWGLITLGNLFTRLRRGQNTAHQRALLRVLKQQLNGEELRQFTVNLWNVNGDRNSTQLRAFLAINAALIPTTISQQGRRLSSAQRRQLIWNRALYGANLSYNQSTFFSDGNRSLSRSPLFQVPGGEDGPPARRGIGALIRNFNPQDRTRWRGEIRDWLRRALVNYTQEMQGIDLSKASRSDVLTRARERQSPGWGMRHLSQVESTSQRGHHELPAMALTLLLRGIDEYGDNDLGQTAAALEQAKGGMERFHPLVAAHDYAQEYQAERNATPAARQNVILLELLMGVGNVDPGLERNLTNLSTQPHLPEIVPPELLQQSVRHGVATKTLQAQIRSHLGKMGLPKSELARLDARASASAAAFQRHLRDTPRTTRFLNQMAGRGLSPRARRALLQMDPQHFAVIRTLYQRLANQLPGEGATQTRLAFYQALQSGDPSHILETGRQLAGPQMAHLGISQLRPEWIRKNAKQDLLKTGKLSEETAKQLRRLASLSTKQDLLSLYFSKKGLVNLGDGQQMKNASKSQWNVPPNGPLGRLSGKQFFDTWQQLAKTTQKHRMEFLEESLRHNLAAELLAKYRETLTKDLERFLAKEIKGVATKTVATVPGLERLGGPPTKNLSRVYRSVVDPKAKLSSIQFSFLRQGGSPESFIRNQVEIRSRQWLSLLEKNITTDPKSTEGKRFSKALQRLLPQSTKADEAIQVAADLRRVLKVRTKSGLQLEQLGTDLAATGKRFLGELFDLDHKASPSGTRHLTKTAHQPLPGSALGNLVTRLIDIYDDHLAPHTKHLSQKNPTTQASLSHESKNKIGLASLKAAVAVKVSTPQKGSTSFVERAKRAFNEYEEVDATYKRLYHEEKDGFVEYHQYKQTSDDNAQKTRRQFDRAMRELHGVVRSIRDNRTIIRHYRQVRESKNWKNGKIKREEKNHYKTSVRRACSRLSRLIGKNEKSTDIIAECRGLGKALSGNGVLTRRYQAFDSLNRALQTTLTTRAMGEQSHLSAIHNKVMERMRGLGLHRRFEALPPEATASGMASPLDTFIAQVAKRPRTHQGWLRRALLSRNAKGQNLLQQVASQEGLADYIALGRLTPRQLQALYREDSLARPLLVRASIPMAWFQGELTPCARYLTQPFSPSFVSCLNQVGRARFDELSRVRPAVQSTLNAIRLQNRRRLRGALRAQLHQTLTGPPPLPGHSGTPVPDSEMSEFLTHLEKANYRVQRLQSVGEAAEQGNERQRLRRYFELRVRLRVAARATLEDPQWERSTLIQHLLRDLREEGIIGSPLDTRLGFRLTEREVLRLLREERRRGLVGPALAHLGRFGIVFRNGGLDTRDARLIAEPSNMNLPPETLWRTAGEALAGSQVNRPQPNTYTENWVESHRRNSLMAMLIDREQRRLRAVNENLSQSAAFRQARTAVLAAAGAGYDRIQTRRRELNRIEQSNQLSGLFSQPNSQPTPGFPRYLPGQSPDDIAAERTRLAEGAHRQLQEWGVLLDPNTLGYALGRLHGNTPASNQAIRHTLTQLRRRGGEPIHQYLRSEIQGNTLQVPHLGPAIVRGRQPIAARRTEILNELAKWGIRWNGRGIDFSQMRVDTSDTSTDETVPFEYTLAKSIDLPRLKSLLQEFALVNLQNPEDGGLASLGMDPRTGAWARLRAVLLMQWGGRGQPSVFPFNDHLAVRVTYQAGGDPEIELLELGPLRTAAQHALQEIRRDMAANSRWNARIRDAENVVWPSSVHDWFISHDRNTEAFDAASADPDRPTRQAVRAGEGVMWGLEALERFGDIAPDTSQPGLGAHALATGMRQSFRNGLVVDVDELMANIRRDVFYRNVSLGITAGLAVASAALMFVPGGQPLSVMMMMAAVKGAFMGAALHMVHRGSADIIGAMHGREHHPQAYWTDDFSQLVTSMGIFAAAGATGPLFQGMGTAARFSANLGSMGVASGTGLTANQLITNHFIDGNPNAPIEWAQIARGSAMNMVYALGIDGFGARLTPGLLNALRLGWVNRIPTLAWASRWFVAKHLMDGISSGMRTWEYLEQNGHLAKGLQEARKAGNLPQVYELYRQLTKRGINDWWHSLQSGYWSDFATHTYFGVIHANHAPVAFRPSRVFRLGSAHGENLRNQIRGLEARLRAAGDNPRPELLSEHQRLISQLESTEARGGVEGRPLDFVALSEQLLAPRHLRRRLARLRAARERATTDESRQSLDQQIEGLRFSILERIVNPRGRHRNAPPQEAATLAEMVRLRQALAQATNPLQAEALRNRIQELHEAIVLPRLVQGMTHGQGPELRDMVELARIATGESQPAQGRSPRVAMTRTQAQRLLDAIGRQMGFAFESGFNPPGENHTNSPRAGTVSELFARALLQRPSAGRYFGGRRHLSLDMAYFRDFIRNERQRIQGLINGSQESAPPETLNGLPAHLQDLINQDYTTFAPRSRRRRQRELNERFRALQAAEAMLMANTGQNPQSLISFDELMAHRTEPWAMGVLTAVGNYQYRLGNQLNHRWLFRRVVRRTHGEHFAQFASQYGRPGQSWSEVVSAFQAFRQGTDAGLLRVISRPSPGSGQYQVPPEAALALGPETYRRALRLVLQRDHQGTNPDRFLHFIDRLSEATGQMPTFEQALRVYRTELRRLVEAGQYRQALVGGRPTPGTTPSRLGPAYSGGDLAPMLTGVPGEQILLNSLRSLAVQSNITRTTTGAQRPSTLVLQGNLDTAAQFLHLATTGAAQTQALRRAILQLSRAEAYELLYYHSDRSSRGWFRNQVIQALAERRQTTPERVARHLDQLLSEYTAQPLRHVRIP